MCAFEPSISKVEPGQSLQSRIKNGRSLAQEGSVEEALVEFEALIKIDANSKQAHLGAGRLKYKQKDFDGSLKHFETGIKLDPMKPRGYLAAARVCLAKGDLDRALTHSQDAIKLNPKSAIGYIAAGQVYLKRKNLDEAKANFTKAIQLNPRFVPARHRLAQTIAQQGQTDEAVGQLQSALRIEPDRADTYEGLGRIHLSRKDYSEARASFEKAISLDPKTGTAARLGLAEACIEDGQLAAAEESLRGVPNREQFKARVHKLWGDLYFAQGDYAAAVEEYHATELMMSKETEGGELKIEAIPNLPPKDPKWKKLSEQYRTRIAKQIEARKLEADSTETDVDALDDAT